MAQVTPEAARLARRKDAGQKAISVPRSAHPCLARPVDGAWIAGEMGEVV